MATTAREAAELIERYIEPNPHKPGVAEARLRDYGVSVWVLIEYWYGADFDKTIVAEDYEPPALVHSRCRAATRRRPGAGRRRRGAPRRGGRR